MRCKTRNEGDMQDPLVRLVHTLEEASSDAPFDPTAAALATATLKGRPSLRFVLVKSIDHGVVFYTHTTSRKGGELSQNPQAALTFYWPWIDKQVRLEGAVSLVTESEADTYFASRPRLSQCGAWASKQSQPLADPSILVQEVQAVEQQFANQEIPRPPQWCGFRLLADRIEFWQAGDYRLHEREVYQRENTMWTYQRLYP